MSIHTLGSPLQSVARSVVERSTTPAGGVGDGESEKGEGVGVSILGKHEKQLSKPSNVSNASKNQTTTTTA